MSDYTIQELQEMLNDKIAEENVNIQNNPLSNFNEEINTSNDLKTKR